MESRHYCFICIMIATDVTGWQIMLHYLNFLHVCWKMLEKYLVRTTLSAFGDSKWFIASNS